MSKDIMKKEKEKKGVVLLLNAEQERPEDKTSGCPCGITRNHGEGDLPNSKDRPGSNSNLSTTSKVLNHPAGPLYNKEETAFQRDIPRNVQQCLIHGVSNDHSHANPASDRCYLKTWLRCNRDVVRF